MSGIGLQIRKIIGVALICILTFQPLAHGAIHKSTIAPIEWATIYSSSFLGAILATAVLLYWDTTQPHNESGFANIGNFAQGVNLYLLISLVAVPWGSTAGATIAAETLGFKVDFLKTLTGAYIGSAFAFFSPIALLTSPLGATQVIELDIRKNGTQEAEEKDQLRLPADLKLQTF